MKYILIYLGCLIGVLVAIGFVILLCKFIDFIYRKTNIDFATDILIIIPILLFTFFPFLMILDYMGVIE
jgi:hypothetical protein